MKIVIFILLFFMTSIVYGQKKHIIYDTVKICLKRIDYDVWIDSPYNICIVKNWRKHYFTFLDDEGYPIKWIHLKYRGKTKSGFYKYSVYNQINYREYFQAYSTHKLSKLGKKRQGAIVLFYNQVSKKQLKVLFK